MKKTLWQGTAAIAILGDVVYILWIFYNGMDEAFKGTVVQIASYIGIMVLLLANAVLLVRSVRRSK